MIKLDNVKINYDNFTISYNNHVFNNNTITIIKGPNGSGKTTLLKAIANLLPHQGDITTEGYATFNSQTPILFNMTVYENIIYPLKIRKKDLSKYQKQINKYLTLFDLVTLKDTNATCLSSGEKMKTSIIRSIIFKPDILLLDEPTTALDIESITALTALLKELKKDTTILISSHDRLFIEDLKDDIYLLGDNYVER